MRNLSRSTQVIVAAGTATAALALVWPAQAPGYNFLGGSLDLAQRDVRVFNNFGDPSANDNAQTDPDFPGAFGAPLAIWKGAIEWSSERHGFGGGDPHQPGGLGSGGANFDVSWQGIASSAGGPDDNVVSEITGSNGGVYAFCETPIADGWRIRFWQIPTVLHDGPGRFYPVSFPHMDIQGIMAHEYGHALGLAHTNDTNATMFAGADPFSILGMRSIDTDDKNGVQALYGARASTKPHVTTYTLSAGTITIKGQGFSLAGNEVWFTNGSAAADGTPLKSAGLASQNGRTEITLPIPVDAAPGDLLVKSADSGGASLSNPFPFDPSFEPCTPPVAYGTAKTTSIATVPVLATRGRPYFSTQDFEITITGATPSSRGVVFYGSAPTAAPMYGGTLLVSRPLVRAGFFLTDAFGEAIVQVPIPSAFVGNVRYFQASFQDAGDAFGVGLANALEVRFCP
jgi:hypothetical protein